MSSPSHSGYSVHVISRIYSKDELSVRRINRLNIIIISLSLNINRYRRHLEISIPENPAKIETNRFRVETSSKKRRRFRVDINLDGSSVFKSCQQTNPPQTNFAP